MTKKTKAPLREGVAKTKAPVREGLAFLIEDVLERSEVVIAAESIIEKLQNMAEDLSTIEAKDIMPLLDSLTNSFGPEVAQKFNAVATEQVRSLITAVQQAKTALDGEILRLKQGVEGGDMTDMAMDASKPMMPSVSPGEPVAPEAGAEPAPGADAGLSDLPAPAGDDGMGGEGEPIGGSFAGRAKKEGAVKRGKMIKEAPLGSPNHRRERNSMFHDDVPLGVGSGLANYTVGDLVAKKAGLSKQAPAPQPDPSHESPHMVGNLDDVANFHSGAGKLAHNIRVMIRTGRLSFEERKSLANVLSHLASIARDPAHWSGIDAGAKVQQALQAAGIWDDSNPEVAKVVAQLKRFAYQLDLHHNDTMLESNIAMLRKAANPDAVILHHFRSKLAESHDGQMAAIRTARMFAIDIEDVVSVVKEAATRRPFREDAPPLAQGVPMFPIDQSTPVNAGQPAAAPDNAAPMQPTTTVPPNQSGSTVKPMSPAQQSQQKMAQKSQQNAAQGVAQPAPQSQQQTGQQPPQQPSQGQQKPSQGAQMPGKVINSVPQQPQTADRFRKTK